MKKVCILGLGYIGLPTAAILATHGLQVVGVDNNDRVISTLKNGGIHINEPGLQELTQKALSCGRLRVVNQPEFADAFIIAVPTPFNPDKSADMRAVIAASEEIVPYLRRENLVVLESTSPPRTTVDLVKPILERSGLLGGEDFYLAYSPERVLPGKILEELTNNARVIGGIDATSGEVAMELYRTFAKGEIILTESTSAELVKLMENTYRDINIAIANEFYRLANWFGVDIWEAINIANLHPRVNILKPGLGVGGHCIGVDPWFLVEAAPDLTPLIASARKVNDTQPEFLVSLIGSFLGDLTGRRIAALGLSYKPDVDDLRESPAIEVVSLLSKAGAQIVAYEPNRPEVQFDEFNAVNTFESAVKNAEVLLLLVGHQVFRNLDPQMVRQLSSATVVIDAVNCWMGDEWKLANFSYLKFGSSMPTRIQSFASRDR